MALGAQQSGIKSNHLMCQSSYKSIAVCGWVFRFYIVQVNNIPSIKCQLSVSSAVHSNVKLGQGQSMWLDLRRLISIVSRGSAATSYERGGNVLTRTIKVV